MNYYIIHPLSQHIIRKNCLVGFEDEWNLDKLNTDLSFKKTKRKSSESPKELLESARGDWGIPKSGWVEVHADSSMSIGEVWKVAMSKIDEKEVYV